DVPPGFSLTGAEYTPDSTIGIGVKLILAGTISSESICSYNALFEIVFTNPDSGQTSRIHSVGLRGSVRIMSELEIPGELLYADSLTTEITQTEVDNWPAPNLDAPICGYVSIDYNFTQKVMRGNFAIYLRAMVGQDTVIYGEALA